MLVLSSLSSINYILSLTVTLPNATVQSLPSTYTLSQLTAWNPQQHVDNHNPVCLSQMFMICISIMLCGVSRCQYYLPCQQYNMIHCLWLLVILFYVLSVLLLYLCSAFYCQYNIICCLPLFVVQYYVLSPLFNSISLGLGSLATSIILSSQLVA